MLKMGVMFILAPLSDSYEDFLLLDFTSFAMSTHGMFFIDSVATRFSAVSTMFFAV